MALALAHALLTVAGIGFAVFIGWLIGTVLRLRSLRHHDREAV